MAKKQKLNYERNPWKMVLYIVAIVALIGCLVFLVYTRRQQKKAYQEELLQLQSQETEYVRPVRETETESETESKSMQETEKAVTGKKTAEAILDTKAEATTEKADETETETESESETETETETESELISTAEKNAHVLLLNASGKAGVAGAWKQELAKEGYRHVSIASYTGSAKEQTRIYIKKNRRKLSEHLQELFANAELNFDTFTEDFEMSDGAEKPENVDVYVLIGREDIPEE